MKKINFVIIILYGLFFYSCNESKNLQYLKGYWEISSVSIEGKEVKNYPFSGTIDYFCIGLYISAIAWTIFYDTIYSFQDLDDRLLDRISQVSDIMSDHTIARSWSICKLLHSQE